MYDVYEMLRYTYRVLQVHIRQANPDEWGPQYCRSWPGYFSASGNHWDNVQWDKSDDGKIECHDGVGGVGGG